MKLDHLARNYLNVTVSIYRMIIVGTIDTLK